MRICVAQGEVYIIVELQRHSDAAMRVAGKVVSKKNSQIYSDFKGKWG